MKKKTSVVLALLLVVTLTLTACLLVACNHDPSAPSEEEKVEATEGLLISNSDFKVFGTSSASYPRSIESWSGSKMYSSGSFRDDVIAGGISLDSSVYAENKAEWDDKDERVRNALVKGGHFDDKDEIKHALMIYQPKLGKDDDDDDIHGPTAYGYTSTSFSLAKGSYYKLTVDVLTLDIAGDDKEGSEPGARIYVSSNTYAEFSGIDTKGEWKTYEIFIETSPASTTSLTLQLGLGKYSSSYTKGLTTGYVFFDNVSLKKLVADPDVKADDVAQLKVENPYQTYKDAVAQELEQQEETAEQAAARVDFAQTATLKVPNGRFDFGSTNLSSSGAPNSWSVVTGNSGLDDPAPTGLGYNAIIDTDNFAEKYSDYAPNYRVKADENAVEDRYYPATALNDITSIVQDYDGRVGSNVFMLSQQLMTAQGIRSSRSITIEKGKTYALSLNIYTYRIHGAGVTLMLTGSDGKDIVIKGISQNLNENVYIGSTIIDPSNSGYGVAVDPTFASTGKWTTYTFYIKGNPYKDYSYNMAIWLGTDGTSSNDAVSYLSYTQSTNAVTYRANGTFSNGWVFIDELMLNEELADLPAADAHISNGNDGDFTLDVSSNNDLTGIIVDLNSENMLASFLDGSDGKTSLEHANAESKDVIGIVGSAGSAPANWKSHFDLTDNKNPIIKDKIQEGVVNLNEADFNGAEGAEPGLPYEDMLDKRAYSVYASEDSYYEVETSAISIEPNQFYRVSFWVKTVNVKSTSGMYVYLLDKTEQGDKDEETVLTSFTRVNTDDFDEYLNDWCEITVVIRGDAYKKTDVALKFTLGTGDRWDYSTLTSGAMYVANFNMASITYANFNSTTTSTYTKSVDLSDSVTYKFTNGDFDSYDPDDDNLDLSQGKPLLSDQTVAAKPQSWTINDSTLGANEKDSSLFAGIIALNKKETPEGKDEERYDGLYYSSSDQATSVTGLDEAYFNQFYGDPEGAGYLSAANRESISGPNLLAIGSKDSTKYALGFASTSFTLSANTYYCLSLFVKTNNNAKASVFLTGETASGSGDTYANNSFVIENADGWTKYMFFIEVGDSGVSLKLNLWLGEDVQYIADKDAEDYGEKAEAAKSAGVVFFDHVVQTTIEDEDAFNEKYDAAHDVNADTVRKISFLVDSFDPVSNTVESRAELASPNGWTGAADTNQTSSNSRMGVIYTGSADFFETEHVRFNANDESDPAGDTFVRLLGEDYDDDDVTVTEEEILEAKRDFPDVYGNMDDLAIREKLAEQKVIDLKRHNWLPVSAVVNGAHSGEHMLVINNTVASAYAYTSSSKTLKAEKYYKVSVFVRTYGLNDPDNDEDQFGDIEVTDEEFQAAKQLPENATKDDDVIRAELLEQKIEQKRAELEIGAYIELYLGSANEPESPFIFKAVRTEVWTQYNFYVQTQADDVTSVTIKLGLGKYSTQDINGKTVIKGLTTGYAMFDDISVDEIEESVYSDAVEAIDDEENVHHADYLTSIYRKVVSETTGNQTEEPGETETPSNKFNTEALWWMIPTIILGLVLIVVVVVFFVRKFHKPSKAEKAAKADNAAAEAQVITSAAINEKHDRYDSDKE